MQTCLVVDDSSVIRKVAGRILAKMDIAVTDVAGPVEALAACETAMPDCILVAGTLGGQGSEDLVRELRKRPGGAQAVILAMLVEANLGQMTRLKRAGASGFIFKPFDRASLTRWIERHRTVEAIAA